MSRIILITLALIASSSPVEAQLCKWDKPEPETEQSNWDQNKKSDQLWDAWFKKVRFEFPKRVSLVYASMYPNLSKSPTYSRLAFDIDTKEQAILKVHQQEKSDFSDFCKQSLGRLLQCSTLKPPNDDVLNPRRNFIIVFQTSTKSAAEVKPQSLSQADVDYLLGLDSSEIKDLLNLPSKDLRKALDSRKTSMR
ncbi:MAG: hypothetical protein JNN26_09860 [Candidatus Obscuribacter sp.]|nr:hypothetical protein [Candidatus Obscuribacter sp.]